jgi:hypothetical protein
MCQNHPYTGEILTEPPRVEFRISPEKAIVPASFVHYEHADTDEMLQMSRQVHDAKATNIVMDAFRYFRK